jgi:serine/threonine-protein kinase
MKVCPVCNKEYSDTQSLCPVDAAALQAANDSLVGQTLAGKYSIKELIKSGGMGSVYRGKHVLMDKTVAIKVLRPSLAVDDVVVARFSREAKAASRISHPHAVSVTDFGESENGVVFLVMEYLDGQTLKQIIRNEGPMPLARAVEIVRQVAGALDAAHQQGVIHRDLKSDNIMLSETNGGDWAKVLDFGIAKIQEPEGARDHDITAPNLVIGTPQYMSPEQCSQTGPIDARSDVYSLGVILYEMLAGRVPFTGESPTVIMMKQVQDTPPSILEARPDLPKGVGEVIERALAKQPANRFQTAGELCEAITAIAADAPAVTAPTVTPDTVANEPVKIEDDADEEVTVVRPREPLVVPRSRQEIPLSTPALEPGIRAVSFSPWRIMVPAAIVLVAVFGIVFLLTRSSGQTPSANQSGQTSVAADPNSQPVQPSGTPTGAGERNIQSANVASPGVSPNANANANRGSQVPSSSVIGDFGANGNRNTSQPRESPGAKASPAVEKNAPPPPPKASPTVKTVVKPETGPPLR